jgi:hypothetical protein
VVIAPAVAPNLLDDSRRYVGGGISLIVVGSDKRARGKWKHRQTTAATVEEIERELQNPLATGVAAVCGKRSGGLLMIDFDEPGLYGRWLALVGDEADGLPVQRTGHESREHYQIAMRCDDPGRNAELAWVPDENEESGRRIAIETRAEGGYAVLPPSLHPSGNRYECIAGDFAEIPYRAQTAVDFMLERARELDEAPYTKQQLLKVAKAAKTKSRAGMNGQVSVIERWNAQHPIGDTLKQFGYVPFGDRFTRPGVDASPGGVVILDGKSYHHSTNDVLHDDHVHDSFDVFTMYQHNGDVKEAVKAAAAELGIDRLREDINTNTADNVEFSQAERAKAGWRIMHASQLGPGDQIDWAVDGLLAFGFITLLTGLWKCGKSTFLSWMIHAMGSGNPFIAAIARSKVLVISEEGAGLWARRRDEIGFTDEIQFLCKPFRGRPSKTEWEHFIVWVAEGVRDGKFRVVIFDTISSMWPCDNENDASKVIAAMNPLHHLTEAGAAVLLVHHPRKGDGTEGQASRGSGALPGFVDTILELRRYEPENAKDCRRTITGLGRFDETPAEMVIELTTAGYRAVGSKADAKQSDRMAVIRSMLDEQREGVKLTVDGIREQWNSDIVPKPGLRALTYDLKQGWIDNLWQREGGGVKNDPYLYFPFPHLRPPTVQESNCSTQNAIPARYNLKGCRNRIGGDE